MAERKRDELPIGDGPRYPWAQRHFGRSVGVVALGVGTVLIGAWLGVRWLGAAGIVLALLGGIGLLHVQIAWTEDVADSFRSPRAEKRRASQQEAQGEGSERRPDDV